MKRIPYEGNSPDFKKNRREVLAACIDYGINYADLPAQGKVLFVAEALEWAKKTGKARFTGVSSPTTGPGSPRRWPSIRRLK